MKNIIQLSGGKDSLALFLLAIEKGYKIDEVVYFDVGKWEFNATRKNIDKCEKICVDKKIKFTRLHPKIPYPILAWEREYIQRNGNRKKGYGWCGGVCRWGTTQKIETLEQHGKGELQIIGIATDETTRLVKERKGNKAFWLDEWGMTEADCLKYCYEQGWDWLEYEPITGQWIDLYSVLDRVSCWCCKNKNLKELYNIYRFLPSYWEKLRTYQEKTNRPFKNSGSIFQLEERFAKGCVTKNDVKALEKNEVSG